MAKSMNVTLDTMVEQVSQSRKDIGRVEAAVDRTFQSFAESATKQGERIGDLETELAELRRDFYWATRLTVGAWGAIQALGLLFLGWYLK